MQLTLVSVHCCELCALKQKPGVLLEKPISPSPCNRGLVRLQTTKSQLQTVLITASGPQALNALVHRERYTQGSRQNRCVSSQKALALRAKVGGTGPESAIWKRACCLGYTGFRPCVPFSRATFQCEATVSGSRYPLLLPRHGLGGLLPSQKLPTRNCLRRRIQLCN